MMTIKTRDEWLKTVEKGKIWAEIGVFKGDFSKKIFSIAEPSQLHLVDKFPSWMVSGDKDGNNIEEADLSNTPEVLKNYFKSEKINIHKLTSVEFLSSIDDHSIDIIYIDADHSYDAVTRDLSLSLQKVKKGGIISGHDYCADQFPGVFRAVNEFCSYYSLKIDLLTEDKLPTFVITNL